MSYKLYPLQDRSKLPELCSLFAKGLADTTVDYWLWKHFSHNGHPEGMILVAEAEDGSLAGMFALQPENYRRGEECLVVVQMMDLVIDPRYRGTGLMKRLFQYAKWNYTEKGYWGFTGFPNPKSFPILTKYGAKDMGDISSLETGKRIVPIYIGRKKQQFGCWTLELKEEMPDDLFLTDKISAFQMDKPKAFMEWKFAANPEERFQWLTIRRNGTLEGYLVVHITRGRLRRAVNVYDWGLKNTVGATVLKQAVNLLLTHGNWVELWGRYSEEDQRLWREAGLNRKSDQRTHFLLMPFGANPIPDRWHLTRADLDY